MRKTIGILGMHGSREEHAQMMEKLGYETRFLRSKQDFSDISGIILPGGESTSFGRLLDWTGTKEVFQMKVLQEKLPVFGTCAGSILLAKEGSEYSIGALDITVDRNAYGRQIDSFSEEVTVKNFLSPFHAVFIRAPKIAKVSEDLEILAEHDGNPIVVKDSERNILVSTFHPELTTDTRIHEIFAQMVEGY